MVSFWDSDASIHGSFGVAVSQLIPFAQTRPPSLPNPPQNFPLYGVKAGRGRGDEWGSMAAPVSAAHAAPLLRCRVEAYCV